MARLPILLLLCCGCSARDSNPGHGYNSSTAVDAKAMEQLYYVTNYFIGLVQAGQAYPPGLLRVEGGRLVVAQEAGQTHTLLRHYAGTAAVAGVGVLFIALMPVVGLFFCCCRCAGSCGARPQACDKQGDPCSRLVLGVLLIGVAVVVLFGVVCAFVTNEYMESGVRGLGGTMKTAVEDTRLYMGNTAAEMDDLLVSNFNEMRRSLKDKLDNADEAVVDALSSLISFTKLKDFVDNLEDIKEDVETAENLTQQLTASSSYLQMELSSIKKNLTTNLKQCEAQTECKNTINDIANFDTPANFSQLPNITESIQIGNIDALHEHIRDGKKALDDMKVRIKQSVNNNTPILMDNMDKAGEAIKTNSQSMKDAVRKMMDIIDRSKGVINDVDDGLKKYAHYRYYMDMSISGVMLLLLTCLTLGLFYGFCGKRPDTGYGDDCCNKATGARFLMLGVYVMFLVSALLMAITLARFLVGVFSQKVVCEPLRSPNDSQVFHLVDDMFPLSLGQGDSHTLHMSAIISSCHRNESVYNVLELYRVLNISEVLDYMQRYGLEQKINDLKASINVTMNVTLMDDTVRQQLLQLKNMSTPDLTEFSRVINESMSGRKLEELAGIVRKAADRLTGSYEEIKKSLEYQAEKLVELQRDTVEKMMVQASQLNATLYSLDDKLRFNHSSLSTAVDDLIASIEEGSSNLVANGSKAVIEMIDDFVSTIVQLVDGYLNLVVNRTTTEVGACEPLSQVYNASVVAVCNNIVDPFNGFWASIGWCLVLFIPAIVLSVKLASLYRKSEPYHAALPDSEYLYDAYADRDNIPLANGPDKKNHHRRYNETYDNSSGYMGDYSAHLGRGDRDRRDRSMSGYHQDDARYTDMAPKYTPLGHWDYSNGALARYHSPPMSTEYERPPPYYYPGPGDSGRR